MKTSKNPCWMQISNDFYKQYKNVRSLIEFCFINSIKIPVIICNSRFIWENIESSVRIDITIFDGGKYEYFCKINNLIDESESSETLPNYIYDRLEQYFRE
jgi:hypothetical protein